MQPNGENASWPSSSETKDDKIQFPVSLNGTFKKKKTNVVSCKSMLKGKPVEREDICSETQTNSRRKRIMKKEHDVIHWDILKKYFSKVDNRKKNI